MGSGGGLSVPVELSLLPKNMGGEGSSGERDTPGESWEETRGHEAVDKRRGPAPPSPWGS